MEDKEFFDLHNQIMSYGKGVAPKPIETNDADTFALDNKIQQSNNEIQQLDNKNEQNNADIDTDKTIETNAFDNTSDFEPDEKSLLETIDDSDLMKAVRRTNAYKTYMYSNEDIIKEARRMSQVLNNEGVKISEDIILSSPEALNNVRDVYKTFEKEMDIDKVYEHYPALKNIAEKDPSAAALLLSNMEDVRTAHGIIENAVAGHNQYYVPAKQNAVGTKLFYGEKMSPEDAAKLKDIGKEIKNLKQIPDFFDAPLDNMVGTTSQQISMMIYQMAHGSGYAAAGAVIGYGGTKLLGRAAGTAVGGLAGGALGSAATETLARQNAMRLMGIGARVGGAKAMFDELAGQYYLEALSYKNKAGGQQFTEEQARYMAGIQAAVETAIEIGETEQVLKILGKNPATASAHKTIKDIIANAKNSASAIAQLKELAANVYKVGKVESIEEGKQQLATDLVSNYFATYVAPDGDEEYGLKPYSIGEMATRAGEATIQASVPSVGMGILGSGASSIGVARNFMNTMKLNDVLSEVKVDFNNYKLNQSGINMLKDLKENLADSKLYKEHPEEAVSLLKESLSGSGFEEVTLDTELVKKEEGGQEVLFQMAIDAGLTEEQAQAAIDNNENITVPTEIYAKNIMANPLSEKLLNKISFDKEGDCLERSRKFAASLKRSWDKMIDAEYERKMDAAYNVLKDDLGEDVAMDAMGVIQFYPDDPSAGAKRMANEIQTQIDAEINPILNMMNEGIHQGVEDYWFDKETGEEVDVSDMFGSEETASGGSYGHARFSNNAGWYREFFRRNHRAPTKTEMRDIAIDVYGGKDDYGVLAEAGPMSNEAYEEFVQQGRRLANMIADVSMYNKLSEKLKGYDAGKVAAAEGLTEDGYAAYKYMVDSIKGIETNKATQKSVAVGAMLWAHVAERFAENYQAMGQNVTALDVIKRFRFSDKAIGSGLNQQQSNPVYNYSYEENQMAIKNYFKELKSLDEIANMDVTENYKALLHESKESMLNYIASACEDFLDKELVDPLGDTVRFERPVINGEQLTNEQIAIFYSAKDRKSVDKISLKKAIAFANIKNIVSDPMAIVINSKGNKTYLSVFNTGVGNMSGKVIVSVEETDKGRFITFQVNADKGNKKSTLGDTRSYLTGAKEILYLKGRLSEHPRLPPDQQVSSVDADLHQSGNFILPQFYKDVNKNTNKLSDNVLKLLSSETVKQEIIELDSLYRNSKSNEQKLVALDGSKSTYSLLKWLLIRTSTFKKIFGDWEVEYQKKKLETEYNYAVKVNADDYIFVSMNDSEIKARSLIEPVLGTVKTIAGNWNITKAFAETTFAHNRKTLNVGDKDLRLAALSGLKEGLNHLVYIGEMEDFHHGQIGNNNVKTENYHDKYYAYWIDTGSGKALVYLRVLDQRTESERNQNLGQDKVKLYLHDVFDEEEVEAMRNLSYEDASKVVEERVQSGNAGNDLGFYIVSKFMNQPTNMKVDVLSNGEPDLSSLKDNDPLMQRAWHGTAAIFDNWDLGYAGSGEGGAAHGYGLYFAQDKNVAIGYRNMLVGSVEYLYKGKPLQNLYDQLERKGDWEKLAVIEEFMINQNTDNVLNGEEYFGSKNVQWFKDKVMPYLKGDKESGSLFEVDVPENDVLLDEQKLFGNQEKGVQANIKKAINKLNDEQKQIFKNSYIGNHFQKSSGSEERTGLLNKKTEAENMIRRFKMVGMKKFKTSLQEKSFRKKMSDLQEMGYDVNALEKDETAVSNLIQEWQDKVADIDRQLQEEETIRNNNFQKSKSEAEAKALEELLPNMTGWDVYAGLYMALGTPKDASLALNDVGIKGITYDGESDGRCFVVFDDKAVHTIERFNQAAGEKALTANQQKLAQAINAYNTGEPMDIIYETTGWHLGLDGKWRFEIPDNLNKIDFDAIPAEKWGNAKLGDIYDNPALYAAYPWLKDTMVYVEELDATTKGYTDGVSVTLNLLGLTDGYNEIIDLGENLYTRRVDGRGNAGEWLDENNNPMSEAMQAALADVRAQMQEGFWLVDAISVCIDTAKASVEKAETQLLGLDNQNIAPELKPGLKAGMEKILDKRKEKLQALEFIYNNAGSSMFVKEWVKDNDKAKKIMGETLIHEIQHLVQDHEGFARGGSPDAVQESIGKEMGRVRSEMRDIHPMAWELFTIHEDMAKALGEMNVEEAFKLDAQYNKYADTLGLDKEEKSEIKTLGARYRKLEKQRESDISAFSKYQNLHGEQEARLASKLAAMNTELEEGKAYAVSAEEIFEAWAQGKSDGVIAKGKRWAEIENKYQTDEDGPSIEELVEQQELAEDSEVKELQKTLEDKFMSDWDYEQLQSEYTDAVLKGINEYNAIIIFGGSAVAGSSFNQQMSAVQGAMETVAKGQYVIHIMESADESTFMHEMSHGFFDMMADMASMEGAPEQVVKDYETLRKWCEWNPESINDYKGTAVAREFENLDRLIREAQEKGYAVTKNASGEEVTISYQKLLRQWNQERFARGFEEYLKAGKAPTEGMRGIFSKFKNWLVRIYKGCVGIGAKPTDAVRQVMDRMIATQEEIDYAIKKAELNKWRESGADEMLTKSSKEFYDDLMAKAKEDAESKVLKLALKDLDQAEKDKVEAEIKAEREAATERISQEPVFVVQKYMEQNPELNPETVAQTLGNMSLKTYVETLKARGGSVKSAVDAYMEKYEKSVKKDVQGEEYRAWLKAEAQKAIGTSKYTDLIAAYELQAYKKAVQRLRRLENKLAQIEVKDEAARKEAEAIIKREEKAKAEQEDRDERVRELRTELRELKNNVKVYGKNSQDEIGQARYYAANRLDTLPVGEATDFRKWGNLAVRKHQDAMDMLNAGNLEEATKLQKDVLVYRMLEKRAYELHEKYEKKVARLVARKKTIETSKNIGANDRYLYMHFLYLFGLTEKDAPRPEDFPGVENMLLGNLDGTDDPSVPASAIVNPEEWLKSFITNPDSVPMENGLNSLTMEQYREVEELMDYVYNAGMDRNSIKTLVDDDGTESTIDEVNAAILGDLINSREDKSFMHSAGADSKLESAMKAARKYWVELIKPETILNAMGENAMKYLYNPLRRCADKELQMNKDAIEKQKAIFAQYHDDIIEHLGKEEGEALLKDFSTKKLYVLNGDRIRQSELTHEELVCLALNLGTEIGHKRVLDGYGISEGVLRNLLYNLTSADWTLIQSIWDMHEEYWPELRRVTAAVTGVTMEKQEPREFTVMSRDGVAYPVRGGYYHLAYDRTKNLKVRERDADKRLDTQSNSNRRFGIGVGMTKERNEYEVKYLLDLHLSVMQRAVAETIHYISFYETVRDVNRLVNSEMFAETTVGFFGEEHYLALQKWVKDAWALEPESKTEVERFNAAMRSNQTMATLGFSMITALENALNIFPMMAEIGPKNALEAVLGYYGNMFRRGVTDPREMFAQNQFIADHSIFMAERGESIDPNIYKNQADNGINEPNIVVKPFNKLTDGAFWFITQTDLMLARPLWMHEYQRVYNECIAKQLDPDVAERKAVQAGDAAVRHVFGSSAEIDRAEIQKSRSEIVKFMTMFYSYFSTVHNAMLAKGYEYDKLRHEGKSILQAASPTLVWGVMMWYVLPSVGSAVMRAYLKGDDDDREPEKLAAKIASTFASNVAGGLPFARDAVPALLDLVMGEKVYGFRNVPLYEAAQQTMRTVSAIKGVLDNKKDEIDVMRAMARLSVYMTRFPLTASNAMITAAQWISEGDLTEEDLAKYLQAMVMNKKPKK